MGWVTMETQYDRIPGIYEPVEYATIYVYCDKCGSFNVATDLSVATWVWLAVPIITFALIWNSAKKYALPGAGVFCWGMLFIFLFGILSQQSHELGHRCRKCGNTDISDQNTWNYPSEKRILDVPNHVVHVHRVTIIN